MPFLAAKYLWLPNFLLWLFGETVWFKVRSADPSSKKIRLSIIQKRGLLANFHCVLPEESQIPRWTEVYSAGICAVENS